MIGNRVYETLRGDEERKRVHSLRVLAAAAIPWVGYFAYLTPLRTQSEQAFYLFANHVAYSHSDRSLEEYLRTKPRFIRRIAQRLLFPAGSA